jgi:gliding motility-associated-like protein
VAYKDIDTTIMNTPISFDVVKNDNLKGLTLQELNILTQPKNGQVTKGIDKLTYQPKFDFCGETEMFQYTIRTAEGLDTGTVCIFVKCGVFKIYNGFSPNKDGTNEHFYIEGIEFFPNNAVTIYNRWGNMVYSRERYTNDDGWKGVSNEGQDVPDATYWYCVDLKNGKKYFGWVHLQR